MADEQIESTTNLKTTAVLALGSNLDKPQHQIEQAYMAISKVVGEIRSKSSFWQSEPWGFESSNQFVNTCALVETSLRPNRLLQVVKSIEKSMGRVVNSNTSYTDRVIDIDIILYGHYRLTNDKLEIPHPQFMQRPFVLRPLAELIPNWKMDHVCLSIIELCNKFEADNSCQKL